MAAVGLLRTNSNPTREEARQGLAGNLCRCGSYDSYLDGVMRAAQIG
jgi:aerobic-type carbon monoxide dehydrogenase small subunit (CoxS/CutS family)